MINFPCIILSREMIDAATRRVPKTKVNRAIASSLIRLQEFDAEYQQAKDKFEM